MHTHTHTYTQVYEWQNTHTHTCARVQVSYKTDINIGLNPYNPADFRETVGLWDLGGPLIGNVTRDRKPTDISDVCIEVRQTKMKL
jgi:hypothetical protein